MDHPTLNMSGNKIMLEFQRLGDHVEHDNILILPPLLHIIIIQAAFAVIVHP